VFVAGGAHSHHRPLDLSDHTAALLRGGSNQYIERKGGEFSLAVAMKKKFKFEKKK